MLMTKMTRTGYTKSFSAYDKRRQTDSRGSSAKKGKLKLVQVTLQPMLTQCK